ncbi:MAG TPA: hypothetical protein VGM29_05985 [Polyangiaceae bacterium]
MVRTVGLTSALVLVVLARPASAQSTASFPPPTPLPVPVRPSPPAAPPSVAPSTSKPSAVPGPTPATAPAAVPQPRAAPAAPNALDNRYPVLPQSSTPARALGVDASQALYPPVLPFEPGMTVPPGYHAEHRYANGLIFGGMATVGIAYGVGLIEGGGQGNGLGWLALPVIGPWAAMASRKFSCANDPLEAQACVNKASHEVRTMALLSADAVVQTTGAVLFFIGLGSGHDELVRNDQVSVRLAPTASAGRFGLDLFGSF